MILTLVWRLRLFGRNAGFVDKDIETRTALPAEHDGPGLEFAR